MDEQIKKNEMDGKCGVFEGEERHVEGFYGWTGRNHLENLSVDRG